MTEHVRRGAAEDAAEAPLTETEIEAGQRPPSTGGGVPVDDMADDDEAGVAGGASGGGGGTSTMPGHPDSANGS